MKRICFARQFILCWMAVLFLLTGSAITHAETSAAPARDLTREFSTIPSSDKLYTQLQGVLAAIAHANGQPTSVVSSTSMTRYEMALEVTKALITIRAQHQSDRKWLSKLPESSLRALRALCLELQAELTRFDVDAQATIADLNAWSRTVDTNDSASHFILRKNSSLAQTVSLVNNSEAGVLKIPLSQRLRVYGALSTLERSTQDPLRSHTLNSAANSRRPNNSEPQAFGIFGSEFDVTDRIQLRGEVSRRPMPRTLREVLKSESAASGNDVEQSFGGGVDVDLGAGLTLTGDVTHYETSGGMFSGLTHFRGTKYEGGVGLAGWENRVALSANLSRLVPEDSLALTMSAAQLNLDVGLTQQISLKLLYQQLFESSQQSRGERMIAGGINISF